MKACGNFIRTLRTGLLTVYILHSSLQINASASILTEALVPDTTRQLIGPNNSSEAKATTDLLVIPKNIILADVTFTEMIDIPLIGVFSGSTAWGDYNNDGYLDILITGVFDYASPPISKLYKNNGNNTFSEQTSISLTGVGNSSVVWGDYDNDGDLDILLSGLDNTGPVCKIYRNDRNNIFTGMNSIVLTGVGSGSVRWGDYDNDGDLDILLTGNAISKIYRNDRNDIFTEQTSISLPGVNNSAVAWGDYDNDGDLDILITGYTNNGYISKIYRNDPNNIFTEQSSISLTGVNQSAVAWGDYDNDGDLDILLSGYSNSGYISKIYRNSGNNIFAEQSSISLAGVANCSVQWADFDNDGDLDILLNGSTGGIPYVLSKIYRNDGNNIFTEETGISLSAYAGGSIQWGDYDSDGDLDIFLAQMNNSIIYRNECTKANISPNVPNGLTNTANGKNVTLSWTARGDTETPSSALTYNVRVGTTPGGSEIVSPHALSNGKLTLPVLGNAQLGTTFNLKNLPMKTYYWSVQAVDNGFKGSAFSAEASFTLLNADPTVTSLVSKDITVYGAVISGTVNPNNATTTVTLEYGTTAGVYSIWKSVAATPATLTGANSAPFEIRLTGLNSGTSYYYRVKAVNSLGTSYSSDMSFTTPPIFYEMTGIQLPGVSESSSSWGDYDNDGDLDILITGNTNTGPTCKIFRNDMNNIFTEQAGISLTGVGSGFASWGDYDNDGDLDIMLTGNTTSGYASKIYRNDRNNIFKEVINIVLAPVTYGSVVWGDYDNDGDLDILLTGNTSTGYASKIYRNDRNDIFTEQISISLPGVSNSAVAWGDYDNDGDLDILLTGFTNSGYISKIYRNDLNNIFSEQSSISLTGVTNGDVSWGDYDNDGDLDILLSGYSNSGNISKIYRNDGNNVFNDQSSISLAGVASSSVQWGDLDNDGDLDILLSGTTGGTSYAESKIYRNDGNNIFTEQDKTSVAAVFEGSVNWGDYDNDGDLDILLTGWGISKIYRNDYTIQNASPNVPTGLTNTTNGKNVTLSWTARGDAETPSSALTYNVRVGTTPGGSEIVNPHALNNGKLTVPGMGNAQLGTTFSLKNLPMNTYYWSVQAVDNGFKGSAFSTEASFTLLNAQPTVTSFVARDVTVSGAVISGTVNPNNAATTVTFEYGTSAGVYSSWKSVAATPSTLTGAISAPVETRLTGLNSSTSYYFRVKAVNSLGTSYGSDMSFTTPPMFTEMIGIQLTGVNYSSSAWGDYDNDGDLDILITGTNNDYPMCKIYRNDGNNIFTDQTSISLPGVGYSSVSWGDYDNDGDLDILLSGLDQAGPLSKIYRNDRNNIFTEMSEIKLAAVGSGSVTWGDYDNDGDLDILIAGSSNSTTISKIYRNNGNNSFAEQSVSLTGVSGGSVQWGDYDNDGDLDIFLTGYSNSGSVTQIYRNDGNGSFSELTSILLPAVNNSSIQLADYDNDGDLDILLAGNANLGFISKIYRNDGNSTFSEQSSVVLTGVTGGSIQWGDYDNDGDLDILLTGYTGGIPYSVSKIYRNDGNGIFTEQNSISLAAVNEGSVQWGDYDNDGDLDILLTGWGISKIYCNNNIKVNTAPNTPTGLTDAKSGKNVTLSWTIQGDTETPGPALTYNVRVGITPGGSEIVSPHALSNGKLTLPAMGNAQLGTTFYLKNLPFNTYYWSVQAVDNGYRGSTFSKEETFKVGPDVTTGQVEISSTSSATLNGSIDPKGFSLTASFIYGLSETTMTNRINITQQLSNTGGLQNVSAPVSGLTAATYYYRLEASDGSTMTSGAIKTFNANAPWIVSYTANNITVNSASLIATVNPKGNSSVVVFEYGNTPALGQVASTIPNPISGSADQQTTATIVSLNKNTTYYFRVKATNSVGTNYSSVKQFITLCDDIVLSTKPTGLTSICQGTFTSTYTTSSLTAISYIWELTPSTAGTITGTGPAGTVAWNPAFNGNAKVKVRGENGTCQSTWTNWLDVNLIPSPETANIIGSQTVCRGQDYIKYSVVPVNGITYNWSVLGGNILKGEGTAEISVNWLPESDTGSVILTQKLLSTGCTFTDSKKIIINYYKLPALPLIKKKGGINLLICQTPDMAGYQWYLNNEPITGANGQYYEARKTTGIYRVVISDKNGCFSRSEEITLGTTTGLVVYPNPTRGNIYVELSSKLVGEVVIKVVDSYGVIRYTGKSEKTDEKYFKPIVLNNFVKGLYLIDIEIAGEKIGSEKILIY